MSQLIDNLNIIESVKTDIKSAIENKGVDMTGVSFPGYASKIGEITTSFVTVPLNVSVNGTYTPGQGVNGYSQVVVDVPQSVTGFTEKDLTEKTMNITNLNNSASFVASSAFMDNNTIQTVNLPYATSVGYGAFQSCTSLSQVSLPICITIGNAAFQRCSLLTQVSLPICRTIDTYAFYKCSSLTRITLGYSSICRLGFSTALADTQIASGTGSIYVPASLVDSYKSATHWSYYSSVIFPIPE